jgi:hypothetical protein
MPHSPSSASTIHQDTLGLPPEPLGPPLQGLADEQEPLVEPRQSSLPASTLASRLTDEVLPPLKKGASTDNSTGLAANFPALTLASRLTDEVLPPLKKGASTDNSTAHQATFPVSSFGMTSLLTNEVLAPLKEGVITHSSPGPSSVIVPAAFAASIQQSTIPTFATTDATNEPIKWEDDLLIRDIPSNLICHVSKKGGMKSHTQFLFLDESTMVLVFWGCCRI